MSSIRNLCQSYVYPPLSKRWQQGKCILTEEAGAMRHLMGNAIATSAASAMWIRDSIKGTKTYVWAFEPKAIVQLGLSNMAASILRLRIAPLSLALFAMYKAKQSRFLKSQKERELE